MITRELCAAALDMTLAEMAVVLSTIGSAMKLKFGKEISIIALRAAADAIEKSE